MGTYINGEKMAKVSVDVHGIRMARGIVGDDMDCGFQVFGEKSYRTEAGAVKAAQKWVNS